MVSDLEGRNFFKDRDVQDDPYAYFDALREQSPIWQEPHYGVFMVTGYDEARAVYADPENFSSCNNVSGPFRRFPVPSRATTSATSSRPTATNWPSAISCRPSTRRSTPLIAG